MYEVHAPAVYIHQRALSTSDRRARVARMLAHVHCPVEPEIVDDGRLNEISTTNAWPAKSSWRTGQWGLSGDPVLVFNAFTWDTADERARRRKQYPALATRMLDGGAAWSLRKGRDFYGGRGTVCQNAWELHSAFGCLHRCDYCHIGGFLSIMVNLEELVERLPALIKENPWLQLYKYDNQTDTIAFEPEYGASELMVNFFAGCESEYLMLYTKSANGRVRVSLCNETTEIWGELGPRLGMTPEDYICGCGPTSVPGNPLFPGARPE